MTTTLARNALYTLVLSGAELEALRTAAAVRAGWADGSADWVASSWEPDDCTPDTRKIPRDEHVAELRREGEHLRQVGKKMDALVAR